MPSSVIQRYLYDQGKQELIVTFVTGRTYAYQDVPREIYDAFAAASSKGAFFNAEIRDTYYMRELD